MKLVPGTIYFVRETDLNTSGHSDLVKIGLVAGQRSPYERLREHQTGNPRKLLFDERQFVWTDAVAFVEAQLHMRYAKQRVSGEWFQFRSEQEISDAVASAREFAEMAASINPLMIRAEELYWQHSEGEVLGSTPESRAFGEDFVRAEYLCDLLEKQMSEVKKAMLIIAEEEGAGSIEAFYKTVEYTKAPAFSPALLKSKFGQEMYDSYAYQEPKWSPKFEVTSPLVEQAEFNRLLEKIASVAEQVSDLRRVHDVFGLNELDLEIRTLLAPLQWNQVYAETHLKVLCGGRPGIEGVCKWVRRESLGNKQIDKGRLFAEKPDVFEASIAPGAKVTSKIRMPFKK